MWRACFLAMLATATLAAQPPTATLPDVLKLAAGYAADYQQKLAGVVAEESFRQSMFRVIPGASASIPIKRDIRSDLLLVRLDGEDRWVQFRDVFEVNDKPIRDRDERLVNLFLRPTQQSRSLAEAISLESARFNVGPRRTINVPLLALVFLEARHQPRFTFRRVDLGKVPDLDASTSAAIWAIEYRENSRPSLIRGESNREMPTSGRVWIDTSTGRIHRTELKCGDATITATIVVTFRPEAGFDLLMPGELKESYLLPTSQTRIEGTATYSRFRQFKVATTEKIGQ